MHHLIQDLEKSTNKKIIPDLRAGYTVRVHQKIKEGKKERIQIFEGLIIDVHGGRELRASIKVRKIASGVGVEKTFIINSPFIEKIEVVRQAKVRRAKLFYIRRTDQDNKMKDDKVGLAKTQKKVEDEEIAKSEKEAADKKIAEAEKKTEVDKPTTKDKKTESQEKQTDKK